MHRSECGVNFSKQKVHIGYGNLMDCMVNSPPQFRPEIFVAWFIKINGSSHDAVPHNITAVLGNSPNPNDRHSL